MPIGPRVISAADWTKKQQTRATAAAEDWLQGVLNPTADPIQAAIKADGKRRNALAEAEKEGRWLKAMNKVNPEVMMEVIKNVGSEGYVKGLAARAPKVAAAVERLQPLVAELAKSIDAMPQDTDAQREARMLAALRGMKGIGKKLVGIA